MIKNYAQTLYSTKCKGFKTNGLAFRNGHEIEENMVKQTAMIKILRTRKMIGSELRRVNLQSTNTENTDNYKLAEKQDQNTMVGAWRLSLPNFKQTICIFVTNLKVKIRQIPMNVRNIFTNTPTFSVTKPTHSLYVDENFAAARK